MNNPESNFASWLHKADHDLLNINNNLAASEIPWDTICFHSQQIAEKVLKGFLVYHSLNCIIMAGEPIWTKSNAFPDRGFRP